MRVKAFSAAAVSLVLILVVSAARESHAGDEPNVLPGRVAALETVVSQLSARIAALEAQERPTTVTAKSVGQLQTKTVWRSLRKGMTSEQVKSILGDPGKIANWSYCEIWYYPNALGGTVTFDDAGHLSGWSEPN